LTKTTYQNDVLKDTKVIKGDEEVNDLVTTLGVYDYILAKGKSSYLNNGKTYYLLGNDGEGLNLYVDDDGSIQSCNSLEGYGIRAVITLKANLEVSAGDGTVDNPYVINMGENNNYIDQYVRLGNDTWRIFNDDDGILKMYTYGYLLVNGEEILKSYSNKNSYFNLNDKTNIAYYLNNTYFNSLSYKDLLVDNNYYVGEISADTGYDFKNIYTDSVVCKVGLLNIFDYNSNNYFENYFYMNTTSSVGSMQYVGHANGFLEEANIEEIKHIVPVISINSNVITGGTGTVADPYVVE